MSSVTTWVTPSPSSMMAWASELQTRCERGLEGRDGVGLRGFTPLLPLASRRTVSLVDVSPSMEMELKLASTAVVEHGVEVLGAGGEVGEEVDEHGGVRRTELGADHAGALGAAEEADGLAVDFEGGVGDFEFGVGGEDGGGEGFGVRRACCRARRRRRGWRR